MSLEAWVAFCATETVLCFTPGPAVLLVVSVALARGLRPSLGAALGILSANALYFALSATGVAAALVASRELFLALRWAGAGYLVWLGLRMVLSGASRERAAGSVLPTGSFVRGLVVQGANPKALIFFMALLPQFIDPAASVATQVLILGASSIAIESATLCIYAWGAFGARRLAGKSVSRTLERVGGGFLIAAGARLAAVRSA